MSAVLMHPYAQTNIQLYNQLRKGGYAAHDVAGLHTAYELTMRLFAGKFRPSGKPFINHLVGTASILASIRCETALISAGLLHAAYAQGDFESGQKGPSDMNRLQVSQVIGHSAEDYIARYTLFIWRSKGLTAILENINHMEVRDRNVVLMRLANLLEDLLDLGILFSPAAESRKKKLNEYNQTVIEMAHRLGYPALAGELETATHTILKAEIPEGLRNKSGLGLLTE